MAPNRLVLEEDSEDGVTVMHRITKMLQMNDSVTRIRVEIESESPLSLKDIPEVTEPETPESEKPAESEPEPEPEDEDESDQLEEPEEPEEEPDEEPEKEPSFTRKDTYAYQITKALVDADRGLHLDELKDALGGPDEAPANPSSNLYSLVDRGFVDKQKKDHPHRDRRLYRYYATSKGERAVANTD